ncbi:MAG: cobalamin/Fe(3+)-siderophore ABC transporter ATP-binding protein [Cyanobacteria bacterium QH_1_48_107]|jgi:iron complex transport system ATP-binding protein|nr:MAG: cobalamin/Fe(3+)-siderophore ABC transporter ATP-binding protein [Cyanobacteria bacterium QH_1_48_107]PSO77175.1 MAG: cobalamin/Fe(3+)-siderophore ABC transporter ATP-binding protein [Cyanobacteria bacterium QS_4_48_99]
MNQPRHSTHRLETKQLTLGYDGAPIILDLNLAIPAGKITVLVGPNGCGKSTLLRGLARLLKPRRGKVYLDGADIFKLSTKAVAKRLGMLPQSPTAPKELTVRDLVAQGRYPHQNWLQQWSKEDEQMVEQALATTGMTQLADRTVDTLSGGQRQRAWLAMALAQDTEILLLDEPTTFLDLAHQMEILDLLDELNERQKRTIVIVLHDLNQACRYADYLVAVREGQVHVQGTPEEVITEETVREVFEVESRIMPDPVAGTPMCIPVGRKGKVSDRA